MLKKKMAVLVSCVVILAGILSGCGNNGSAGSSKASTYKVAMVTGVGGVNDKSFNQSSWEGLTKFAKDNELKTGSDVKYLESQQPTDFAPNLNSLIQQKYNLIVAIGFQMQTDLQNIAQQHQDQHFALIDSVAVDKNNKPLKNVANLTFKEQQGSFLVGVVAGLTTKTNKVGFVGGINSDLIKKFESGFKAGVKTVNPNAQIFVQYAGDFNAPDKGQNIAATLYGKGADIIYAAAGNTGNGVFTEAKSRAKSGQKVWVIGVDKDQYDEGLPENVTLTSMVKRVDQAIYDASAKAKAGKFPGGQVLQYGLKENGVGIAPTIKNVSASVLDQVKKYQQKIIDGSIVVPTTDKEYSTYLASLSK
ncbi:BMP family ABC transporter substrate-binding protein [Sporolactobacillus putidus]|uniref:BMP family ABC transporter substrate-binding protein n=1 Tax=Sporolactobacillus putidus TaxID=492735 RepID=A0A917S4A5_9BACL|nr:BMP family ABC transporter substrate-binding protein [Sporolactobacillus putidus]